VQIFLMVLLSVIPSASCFYLGDDLFSYTVEVRQIFGVIELRAKLTLRGEMLGLNLFSHAFRDIKLFRRVVEDC
jgi:hypothetical protein